MNNIFEDLKPGQAEKYLNTIMIRHEETRRLLIELENDKILDWDKKAQIFYYKAIEIFLKMSKPGDILKEELKERNWTQEHFAGISGISLKNLNGIINGRRPITKLTSEKLGKTLGISAEFWLNMERKV